MITSANTLAYLAFTTHAVIVGYILLLLKFLSANQFHKVQPRKISSSCLQYSISGLLF